jgi:hypothetical protein
MERDLPFGLQVSVGLLEADIQMRSQFGACGNDDDDDDDSGVGDQE